MRERALQACLACVVALIAASCAARDEGGGGEIETVEVGPGRTSVLTTAYDVVAPERQEAFSGVLPGDFPPDLPLYDPSNLTDFGGDASGRYVVLFTPDAATMVRDRMEVELGRSGWALISGDSERGTYQRGSQSVILDVRDANPGTEIRVEY